MLPISTIFSHTLRRMNKPDDKHGATATAHKTKTKPRADDLPPAQWMEITPKIAADMLTFNKNNRPRVENHVKTLTEEMKAGRWKMNGETIKFGKSGNLLNGQHTLEAVVRANVTITMLVVRGVDDDAFDTMDIGRKRTAADALHFGGESDTRRLAAALTFVGKYEAGAMRNRGFVLTPMQVEDLLVKHHGIRDSVKYINELGSLPLSFSIAAGVHYLTAQADKKLADDVFKMIATGAGMEAGHPILLLRERLIENKNSRVGKLDATHVAALVIKAINHAMRGERPAFIRFRAGGENAEAFPKIAQPEAAQ